MIRYVPLAFFALFLMASSCQRNQEPVLISEDDLKEALIQMNKEKKEQEKKDIEQYIEEQNWETTETGTGLHYYIYEEGSGEKGMKGQVASISYTSSLLDGTPCYSSTDNGPKVFRIEHDEVESGLHEVLQLLREGDKAKVVIPSFLAFGVTGDQNKIPGNAILIYDLEVLSLQ